MNILNTIGDCILIINKDQKIVFANKALLQRVRLKAGDVIGKDCHVFSHSLPTPCYTEEKAYTCPHQKVFATGETISVTHTHIMPDGTERVFEITASPVMNEKGNINEMIEVLRDVTDRVEIEGKLRESEEELRALVENSLAGVYLIQDGTFKYVNPRIAEIFGYSQDDLIDKKGPKDLTYPDDWHIVNENIRKRIEGRIKSVNYTFRGQRKDGEIIDVEVFDSMVIYKGKPAVIGTLLDITERRYFQRELEKRIKELEEFYDIAINRELKMIELNKEIERLKEQLKSEKNP